MPGRASHRCYAWMPTSSLFRMMPRASPCGLICTSVDSDSYTARNSQVFSAGQQEEITSPPRLASA